MEKPGATAGAAGSNAILDEVQNMEDEEEVSQENRSFQARVLASPTRITRFLLSTHDVNDTRCLAFPQAVSFCRFLGLVRKTDLKDRTSRPEHRWHAQVHFFVGRWLRFRRYVS